MRLKKLRCRIFENIFTSFHKFLMMEDDQKISCRKREVFQKKFEEVLRLMIANRLRKDIDDGLLEKLLNILQIQSDNNELIGYLETTSLIKLFESILSAANDRSEAFCPYLIAFVIRAFGLFMQQQHSFNVIEEEKTCLQLFSCIVQQNCESPYCPSIHAAILKSASNLTKHLEGQRFLCTNGYIDKLLPSLYASSYYVRKDARSYFVSLLVNSYSDESLRGDMDALMNRMLSSLLQNSSTENALLLDSYVSIVRECFESSDLLQVQFNKEFCLIEKMCQQIEDSTCAFHPSLSLIPLMATCLKYRKKSCHSLEMNVLQLLLKKSMLSEMILLATQVILSRDEFEMHHNPHLAVPHLKNVLWPLRVVLCERTESSHEYLVSLEDKSVCGAVICTAVSSLSKLAHLFSAEAFVSVLSFCTELLTALQKTPFKVPSLLNVPNSKKISLLIVELFIKMFQVKVIPIFGPDVESMIECLIQVLGKPSDSNLTCQIMKLICLIIKQTSEADMRTCDALEKAGFASVLERKLFDMHWPVTDTALEVILTIVKCLKVDSPLRKSFFDDRALHLAVWDMAFSSEAEGYVRATAISVITAMCSSTELLQKLSNKRAATKNSIIIMLCRLTSHSDVFIQRECVTSLLWWLPDAHNEQKAKIAKVLFYIIRHSLDCQSKVSAVEAWSLIVRKHLEKYSPNQNNIGDILNFFGRTGYGCSILRAMSDSDNVVRCAALQELLSLRKMFINHQLKRSSINDMYEPAEERKDRLFVQPTFIRAPNISKQERDKAIDDVLDQDTASQICNIVRLDVQTRTEVSSRPAPPEEGTSVKMFWKLIWSPDIELTLKNHSKSSDLYVDNPVALLDDIISAKLKSEDTDKVTYQDIDCY